MPAGDIWPNHNETLVRDEGTATGLTVKTKVRAGGTSFNHSETLVRAR
jgi:hypothetical protein